VRVEPVGDPTSVLDAMLRLPATREVVIVLGEPHEDSFLPEHLQCGEELLRLLDRATQVALGVEDEENTTINAMASALEAIAGKATATS